MQRTVFTLFVAIIAQSASTGADLPLPAAIQNGFRLGGTSIGVGAVGVDAVGNTYLAGGFGGARLLNNGFPIPTKNTIGPAGGHPWLFVAKVSPSGKQLLYLTEIGDSNPLYDGVGGMYVNPDGSVILAGLTRASDFPTTEGSLQPHSTNGGAFLLKLDPSGKKLVFSTFLDDSASTGASSLAVDRQGNCYLGGFTTGETFPTTPGAYQRSVAPGSNGSTLVGFVSKISADGKQLLLSTLFTDSPVWHVAVDVQGAIHILGNTLLALMNPSASQLIYSRSFSNTGGYAPLFGIDGQGNTYLALSDYYLPDFIMKFDSTGTMVYNQQIGPGLLEALLVLDDGTVFVGGTTASVSYPTRDTLQPCNMNLPHDYVPVQWWVQSGTLVMLDPTGGIVLSSFLAGAAPNGYGNDGTSVHAFSPDRDGAVRVVGFSTSPDFPGGSDLVAASAPNGFIFGFTLDTKGIKHGGPAAACLAQAATSTEAPAIPATLTTIFGTGLGPDKGVTFRLDQNNRVPTDLAGVRVTVGGMPAPVLYVQDRQINFVVPENLTEPTADVCVGINGVQSCLFAYVGDLFPGIFHTDNTYAVLNEDGTLNTSSNPALAGSVISLFGTGFGPFDRRVLDGSLADQPLARMLYTIRVQFSSPTSPYPPLLQGPFDGDVLYAGAAPQLVSGITQINVRIPKQTIGGTVNVQLLVDGGKVPRYRQPTTASIAVRQVISIGSVPE